MSELRKEIEEEEIKPVRERFDVDNDMKAEWCLDKIRKARKNQNRMKEELERQMQFYLDQIAKVDAEADDEVNFFKSLLAPYFQSRKSEGFTKELKTKVSYKLPTGELMMKHINPTFEYKKEQDKAIAFCKANDELKKYVKVKEELDWKELKQITEISGNGVALKETGELVPGITVTENEDQFDVDVKES